MSSRKRGNVYGDGVNVAARLEGLADPGGICVSRSVHDHVKNKLSVGYQSLGAHSVTNIAEPVQVYRILPEPDAFGKAIGKVWYRLKQWQKVALTVAVALLPVFANLAVKKYIDPTGSSPGIFSFFTEKTALPLPDKPSIAVLPFENMTGDPKQEYFTDGFTEADHHVPVEDLLPVRHLPELVVHLQGQAGEVEEGEQGTRGPVRAGGEHPEIGRPGADQRPADRCDLRSTPVGRALRPRHEGYLRAAG